MNIRPLRSVFFPRRQSTTLAIATYHPGARTTGRDTLQSVNQQIQQLQNEAQMLVNQGKNLARIDFPQLDGLASRLDVCKIELLDRKPGGDRCGRLLRLSLVLER